MMNCDKAKGLLSEYIDGRLLGPESDEVREHLGQCAGCREELNILDEAKDILKLKEKVQVPADMDFAFFGKLKELKRSQKPVDSLYSYYTRYSKQFAAVAAVVVLFFMVSQYAGVPLPTATNPQGMVKVYLAGKNEWVLLERSMNVGKNDIVKTFQNSQVDISVPGLFSMRLKSDTEIKIAKLGSRFTKSEIRYSVEKGKILVYHDQKIMKDSEFNIVTPQSVNTAIGTDFAVSVMPEMNRTWVGVLDGSVLVKPVFGPAGGVLVGSGQKTEVYSGKSPLPPAVLEDKEWGEVEELYQLGGKEQVALLISTGENRVRELLRPCPLYVSQKKDNEVPDIIKETVVIFNNAIRENSKEKHLEAIKRFESIVSEFPDKRYNVQFLLFIGAYYYYLEQYGDSIDTLGRVVAAYPDSRLVSLAECAIGITYEEKVNDPAKAILAYKKVVTDYPDSPDAIEARKGLARLYGKNTK